MPHRPAGFTPAVALTIFTVAIVAGVGRLAAHDRPTGPLHKTRSSVRAKHGMAATSQPLATAAPAGVVVHQPSQELKRPPAVVVVGRELEAHSSLPDGLLPGSGIRVAAAVPDRRDALEGIQGLHEGDDVGVEPGDRGRLSSGHGLTPLG